MIRRLIGFGFISKFIEAFCGILAIGLITNMASPEEIGRFVVIHSFLLLLSPLIDAGLTEAYLRSRDQTQYRKSAYYTINLCISLIAAILLILFSLVVHTQSVDFALYHGTVLALTIFLTGLTRQDQAHLLKEERFNALYMINIVSQISGVFYLYIIFESEKYTERALSERFFIISAVASVLFLSGRKQRLSIVRVSMETIREDLKFSLSILTNRITSGLSLSIDKYIIGLLYGTQVLGVYSIGIQIARLLDSLIRMTLTNIYFPIMSNRNFNYLGWIRSNNTFYALITLGVVFFQVLFPMSINFLMSEKWLPLSEYATTFGIYGLGIVLSGLCSYNSMIRNELFRLSKLNVLNVLIIVIIYLSSRLFNVEFGAALQLVAITNVVYWMASLFYMNRQLFQGTKSIFFGGASTALVISGLINPIYFYQSLLITTTYLVISLMAVYILITEKLI